MFRRSRNSAFISARVSLYFCGIGEVYHSRTILDSQQTLVPQTQDKEDEKREGGDKLEEIKSKLAPFAKPKPKRCAPKSKACPARPLSELKAVS
jgi:hypothetical protein